MKYNIPIEDFLQEFYLASASNYFKNKNLHQNTSKDIKSEGLKIEKFIDLYRLQNYFKNTKTPTLWWLAENDPIVNYYETISHIEKNSSPEKMSYFSLPFGGHLGFTIPYGQKEIADIIDSYIMYWEN